MIGSDAAAARRAYMARVNRVVDHIERHLHEPLKLHDLAKLANFSPYHFHRIFAAMVGETLNQFVQRTRLERAASRLLSEPHASITEVALDAGFASSATFARAFRDAFAMSATTFRQGGHQNLDTPDRKIGKSLRNACEAPFRFTCYFDLQANTPTWRYHMSSPDPLIAHIEVKELPEHYVAYVRHVGPYGQVDLMPKLSESIRQWVAARDLLTPTTELMCVAHDSPAITDANKLRLSVCMPVPPGTRGEGDVGTMSIPGGKHAVARFEIAPARIAEAWNAVMRDWFPESGFQPADGFPYEVVRQNPRQHPEGKIVLDICVPVRPA